MNLSKVKFNFDIEKELSKTKHRNEKIKEWKENIIDLTRMLRDGVEHSDHVKISRLISGYKALIDFANIFNKDK